MGRTEMTVGAFLAGIGVIALVAGPTNTTGRRPATYAGAAVIGGGFLLWSGHRHVQQAKRPSLRLGVTVGSRSTVLLQRTW